ncbi:VanZ family protein [Psychrobacillus sp. MER TA 171]|uniref:VanZ family protein n=1 Tax=Psychrobacillus sp. MER TA 171 TaxID=2939577 RepID=UPI0020406B76|nr:VanZ family protein [Psychrobacillus sp. MER TA 171]MCM3358045.1 VanZ family protein [Psychrobacillus sp. MER TA 171]
MMFKNIWKVLFTIYILLVLNFIVIKFNGNIQHLINTIQMNMERRAQGESSANLVPFRTIKAYIDDISFGIAFINILGNIIPFIPLGFLIPAAIPSQRNIIKTMISCFLLILSIEILQLIFFLGSFDVDDVILNLLSCFIGFMLFIAYKNIFKIVA